MMIFTLDFPAAVSLAVSMPLFLVAVSWLLRSSRETKGRRRSLDPRFVWVCAICTYNYVNTRDDAISVCPRCGSFNKK